MVYMTKRFNAQVIYLSSLTICQGGVLRDEESSLINSVGGESLLGALDLDTRKSKDRSPAGVGKSWRQIDVNYKITVHMRLTRSGSEIFCMSRFKCAQQNCLTVVFIQL